MIPRAFEEGTRRIAKAIRKGPNALDTLNPAVAYTSVPSVFLGRAKMKLAPRIHDKILYADARMMKAHWMAETATAIGVLDVGFGFWWVDPVAAVVVSAGIMKDGAENIGVAVADLIERRPMRTDRAGPEPLQDELRSYGEGSSGAGRRAAT